MTRMLPNPQNKAAVRTGGYKLFVFLRVDSWLNCAKRIIWG